MCAATLHCRLAASVALVGMSVAAGCGQSSQAPPHEATPSQAAESSPSGAGPRPRAGELVGEDGTIIRGVGDRRTHLEVAATLRRLQHEFRAREYRRACRAVDDFLLTQFRVRQVGSQASCAARLRDYASSIRRDRQPRRLKALWVRSYGHIAGIWIEAPGGQRLRVPFSRGEDGNWEIELGSYPNPEVLADALVGSPAKPTRTDASTDAADMHGTGGSKSETE